MKNKKYIVATIHKWNIDQYNKSLSKLEGNWHLISDPKKLTFEYVNSIQPRYIFFPHWSVKVDKKITSNFECVCFHATDVPYGRGGSPIQNLIVRGHKNTVITSLQMTDELDAGPVYFKVPLSLNGIAQEIYERSSKIIFDMINNMVNKEPKPVPQTGKATIFKRRTMEQSVVTKQAKTLEELFDHIRMLDAESYPKAFIEYGNLRIELTKPKLKNGKLTAETNIELKK